MTKKSEKAEKQQGRKIEVEEPVKQEEAKKELEQEETAKEAEAEEKEEPKKEPTAEEKLAELQDRYLRLSAEYDNFRKRSLKEKIDLQKTLRPSKRA